MDYLIDMMSVVETMRTCLIASELDPDTSVAGYAMPNNRHVASAAITMLKARQTMTESLRSLPGSTLIVAPADTDLDDPAMAQGLEASFGGGGYTARQRAAVLNLAWDHISSALDGRESAFELHASGGMDAWRNQVRSRFTRYNELANGVLEALSVDMPEIDVSGLAHFARAARREVSPQRKEDA
jgi:4-hydroxyphenylacetate 3-monooxygenase